MINDKAVPLRLFLASVSDQLGPADRIRIVDQAILLLDQFYAHLPLKRSMFVVDPIGRLTWLRNRVERLSEAAFHREMLSIFTELRDRHTLYLLPDVYRGYTAWLPVLLERCVDGGDEVIVVGHTAVGHAPLTIRPGMRVIHWNGVPIQRAIELAGERYYGSNEAANLVHGLNSMTVRPLDNALWPDEEWADVRLVDGEGSTREVRLVWMVSQVQLAWRKEATESDDSLEQFTEAQDRNAEQSRAVRKALFAPAKALEEPASRLFSLAVDERLPESELAESAAPGKSALPDNLEYRTVETPSGEFGYVRIWSFENTTEGPGRLPIRRFIDLFTKEFSRILGLLPRSGLIIDIRGNPGGRFPVAERVIELLTPGPITPMPIHFRTTPLVEKLCDRAPAGLELAAWARSVRHTLQTGGVYSQGLPFMPFARRYNQHGQVWFGPVVLITDARCYSTADIFAASFQDHGVGIVLGVDGSTGAGGANVWSYEVLARFLQDPEVLRPLPAGASFVIAMRNVTRVRQHTGMTLENIGVLPDELHDMTLSDVFEGNRDLIAHAASLLAGQPARELEAVWTGRCLVLSVVGMDRIDLLVDDRPYRSLDIEEQPVAIDLPRGSEDVEIRGYEASRLVARKLIHHPRTDRA